MWNDYLRNINYNGDGYLDIQMSCKGYFDIANALFHIYSLRASNLWNLGKINFRQMLIKLVTLRHSLEVSRLCAFMACSLIKCYFKWWYLKVQY